MSEPSKPLKMVTCPGCDAKTFIPGDLAPLATEPCKKCGHSIMMPMQLRQFELRAKVGSGGMATVNVEVTQDPTAGWVVQATFTLGGSNPSFAMATAAPAWPYVRGNVTALSGTNAAATLSMYPP